jgi:hypothetical protein
MTEKLALEFRSKGAALARAKTEGFVGVYFGLSTTLGTRVRNEVMMMENISLSIIKLFTESLLCRS